MQGEVGQVPKRNKELTEKEMRNLRLNISTLQISPIHSIHYSLVVKESKSGFFDNDRILVLNMKDKQLSYISKIPEGLIPFFTQSEVKSLKHKSKITREEINSNIISNFKCAPIPGKQASFSIQFKKGNDKQQWQLVTGNAKIMNEWVDLINKALVLQEPKPQIIPQKKELKEQKQNIKINQQLPQLPSNREISHIQNKKPFNDLPNDRLNPPPYTQPIPRQQNNTLNVSNSNMYESQIANMPYSDHVSELKHLRKQQPGLFKTNNELSRPKLHTVEPEIQNIQNNGNIENTLRRNETPKEINSRIITDDKLQVGRKPSEKQFNRQPSRKLETEAFKKDKSNPIKPQESLVRYEEKIDSNHMSYSEEDQQVKPQQNERRLINNSKSGAISRTKINQEYQYPKSNNEYEPVRQISIPGDDQQKYSRQSSKRNIVIRDQSSSEDLRVIRDPAKPASVKSNNFESGKNNMSKNGLGTYNSKRSINNKRWNEVFAQGTSKLDVYEEFIQTSYNVIRQIINQLPLDKNQKQFLPIEVKPPYFTYYSDGIIITLHYFQNAKMVSVGPYSQDAPILYDQNTYELLKRQFYNYNIILNVTGNEGFIKVPLCAYFQYKGIVALCKAQIPQTFSEITPKRYEKQFDIIENQIHTRFMYGSFSSYLHPASKYIILDNMRELIPEIPLQSSEQYYFRKQFLLGYEQVIQDMESCNDAHYQLTQQVLPDFLSRLQSLQTYIVSSTDLLRIAHQSGISLAYLPLLTQNTRSPYIKKVFVTQIVSVILTAIFRSEINHLTTTFPIQQFDQISLEIVNKIFLDCCHTLIQLMFGYSNTAESIWRIIVEQCSQKYKLTISKEDLVPGYLLGAVIERFGLICDFRRSTFNKHNVQFFVKSGNIPKDLLVGFKIKTRRYDLSAISPIIRDIQTILSNDPSTQNFDAIVAMLRLKQQSLPNCMENMEPAILSYLCNFVPYSEHQQFEHIGIYNMVVLQPHNYFSIKLSLLAIKWCIKKKYIDQAFKIYEMKQIENAFWMGEYNPAISQFYDFFSMYYASKGNYQQAIQLAKQSLKNSIKVLGINELPVADKHYQLGNIYFKMGRKDESLKQYTKTKQILNSHNQTQIAQYGMILFKIGLLYLNFGKIGECVSNALEAMKIFDLSQKSELEQIGTIQILSRCYEITKKHNELLKLGDLAANKFNQTEDAQIFQRMIKIFLYIRIKNLSSAEAKAFTTIITKLEEQHSVNKTQAFTFLHRKCKSQILMKKVQNYLDNIVSLYEQCSRKDLFRRYKSLDPNTRFEAEEMLVVFDAIGSMIGYGYLVGPVRQNQ